MLPGLVFFLILLLSQFKQKCFCGKHYKIREHFIYYRVQNVTNTAFYKGGFGLSGMAILDSIFWCGPYLNLESPRKGEPQLGSSVKLCAFSLCTHLRANCVSSLLCSSEHYTQWVQEVAAHSQLLLQSWHTDLWGCWEGCHTLPVCHPSHAMWPLTSGSKGLPEGWHGVGCRHWTSRPAIPL